VRAANFGHFSQEILGTFPKEFFCVRGAENIVVVGGHTVRIHTVRTTRRKGTIFKAVAGTNFQAS
jgi:hypothetical protein